MDASKKQREPVAFKSLAELKRFIRPGVEFKTVSHANHADMVGLTRVVTTVQTVGFYSKIKDQPEHPFSTCNHGKGFYTDFGKAGNYIFDGTTVKVKDARKQDRGVIYGLEFYDREQNMEETMMDRKMVNFIKEQYPPGTRIRLNSMDDPYAPILPGTEGEVDFVDDIGTIHMKWDNGRTLGIVPGEDSFTVLPPKLTTLKLYMPLTADLYERNEYGDLDDSSTLLEGSELRGYQDQIMAALVKSRMPEETERGLMHWYDEADSVDRKVRSAVFTVEKRDRQLWGVAECRVAGELSDTELETLKEYLTGQASDGWCEGFEQREISVDNGGELYVHFWNSDEWSIQTEQELFSPKLAEGLPELCFSTLPGTGELICMHEKEKHIHVHMVIFSTDPKEGYLSRQGIRSIKSALVSTIYRNDRLHIYEQKDEQRGLLRQEAEARMATLIGQMAAGNLQSDKLELLVTDLAQRLQEVSGKKVYGYLPPRVKRIVDEIVDELAKDERVSSAYALWQDLREQLCIDYNQTPPRRVPLSQQKEFKTVRNMVIRETLRLSEMHFTFEDDAIPDEPEPEEPPVPPDPSAERMIHQRARFYRRAKSILDAADADPSEKSMALVTLHRLWEEGYTIAAHQLGKAYQDGLGISIDRKAATEWFQKSAEAGNACSAYALGKLLLEKEQIPQAIHWLRQAAEQNDPYAQYRLGKLLLTGAEGVPKDIDAAIQLLKGSATQGNSFAQYTLGKLYLLGQEVQVDREEALRYFAQAAAQDNTYAQYFIDHQDDFSGAAAGTAILRMLHQMSRIFRENAAQPAIYAGMQIDKKRRRRLQEKRMAMGHKADDHEDISPQMQ